MRVILLSIVSFTLFQSITGCKDLKFFLGKKEITEESNEEGKLIKKIKIKKRSKYLKHEGHVPTIIKTKTWFFDNDQLVEYTIEKKIVSIKFRDGKTLKFKKKNYIR
jgi:hypothetical protein